MGRRRAAGHCFLRLADRLPSHRYGDGGRGRRIRAERRHQRS